MEYLSSIPVPGFCYCTKLFVSNLTCRLWSVLNVTVQRVVMTSSSALTQVFVSETIGSVMVGMTVEICLMNRTAVSDFANRSK